MYNIGDPTNIYFGIATDTPGFRDFVAHIENKKFLDRIPLSPIYHYTDTNGLKGLIENRFFWCTDIEYMNDANELAYAENLIKNQIDEFKAKNQKDAAFFDALESEAFRSINEVYNVYVTCFSEVPDLLSQWRGYGKYCIGFDCNNPFRTGCHLNSPTEWPLARMRKVEYSREKQKKIIAEIIDGLFFLFKKHIPNVDHKYEIVANWYGGNFSGLILEYLLSFKDPIFKEEKEWRLIHLDCKNDGKKNFCNSRNIKFRTRGDHLIPYIESGIRTFDESKFKKGYREEHQNSDEFQEHNIGFDDFMIDKGKFPISYIGIGPINYIDIAQKAVIKHLQKNGYKDVKVTRTDSNIRSDWL